LSAAHAAAMPGGKPVKTAAGDSPTIRTRMALVAGKLA